MDSEQELRKSGRSTRRASYSEAREMDSFDDDLEASGLATPPPNTPKKSRRASVDDGNAKSGSDAVGVDESKHSFKFTMTREEFLKDLYSFMRSRGQPISKLPSLGYQELDLYLLYQLVIARGGMDEVTRKQEWKLVYQDLGIPTMSTSASYNTRTNYKKYMYLYELEHCDFPDKNRPKDAKPKYQIGEFIRIVSSVFEGQVFYARILKCRFRDGKNQYYVHYNGWNSSHDEWMREDVLDPLEPSERKAPDMLSNPPPSRSSKSNHLIYDPSVSEKVINNLVSSSQNKPLKSSMQNPLSPASPAQFKKNRKNAQNDLSYGISSEDEEIMAANELIMGMERSQREERCVSDDLYVPSSRSSSSYYAKEPQVYRPVEILRYPMRSDPGEDIAKILEDKRNGSHEQDLIHRNRLHTHVLMQSNKGTDDDERERRMIAELLGSVKTRIEQDYNNVEYAPEQPAKLTKSKSNINIRSKETDSSVNDPRNLHDIQESLVSLQASILATQNSYKHAMKALKKHHNMQILPPMPPQSKKNYIGTRRSERS